MHELCLKCSPMTLQLQIVTLPICPVTCEVVLCRSSVLQGSLQGKEGVKTEFETEIEREEYKVFIVLL